jgi:carboxypeptidase family protein
MRYPSLVGGVAVVIAVVGLMAACDGDRQPAPIAGPSANAQPVFVGVEISGPASIPPGQSAQFTAITRLSDGTSQAATSVRWSSHAGLIRVDPTGLATAVQRTGEDILYADLTSTTGGVRRGSREILILPDGTYRMTGVVAENDAPTTPVVGARIEVTNGTPVDAITDWNGRYVMYGVGGTADIRVSKEGYQPHVQRLQLVEHGIQNFQLALSGARLDLAGEYTLAIDVECATSTPVPEDLRHRSYAAVLTQNGSTVELVLTEFSRFRVNGAGRGDRFSGRADATGATFNVGENFWPYYPPYDPRTYPNVVERIPDGTFLVVDGLARTRGTRTRLSGDLDGFALHYASVFPTALPSRSGTTLGTCFSRAHRFTLTRR